MKQSLAIALIILLTAHIATAQNGQDFNLSSPDGSIVVNVKADDNLSWEAKLGQQQIIALSVISLKLSDGTVLGEKVKVVSSKKQTVNTSFTAVNYKKKTVTDNYNQLALNFKGSYGVIFRVYNDGVAYQFQLLDKKELTIQAETAEFNLDKDYKVFIPFARDFRLPGDQYISSFEALYTEANLSTVKSDSLAFLPLLIDFGNGVKAAILDAALENYPGMLMRKNNAKANSLKADFAAYPLKETNGGFGNFNYVVSERAPYIAEFKPGTSLPWRAVVIGKSDKDLANNDMVQKLASPSRVSDVSWIKPGKVAWDWWNNWNLSKVNFRAGINTQTYKYYIDFASANKLEYIIMDEGWSDPVELLKISPDIDLQGLIDYGKSKNVGIILWASWLGINKYMDPVFSKYSAMGIKGFKIDFLDRDDQKMTASTYTIAAHAAKYHLMIDLHGVYKPDGLQRTYPNVVNYEGVKGMENAKWTPHDDMPRYEVSVPFIRMLAGPMDYTPGAMRNATKANFRAVNSNPMSQGTRCHQMAMYVVYEAPLEMLADNPTAYMKEQESTTFISRIPTTFDQTVALDGKVGEYVAIAREKNNEWFIAAMTNWNAKDISLDLSFLPAGKYKAEIFKDGINADREGTDYATETVSVNTGSKLNIHMASGGGWVARISKESN